MSKKEPQNCWEFWNCNIRVRKKCPAYINNLGKDCWMIAGSITKDPACPKLKHQFRNCWQCDWFKKLKPDFK